MEFVNWLAKKAPKVYLLNTTEYPAFEYPRGTGSMHKYPYYEVAGRRIPNGHMAFAGLFGGYVLFKVVSLAFGKSAKPVAAKPVEFPEAKRNWEAEKQEYVAKYVAEGVKHHAHHH